MDVELDAIEAVAAGVPHRFDRDLILVGGGDRHAARKRLHAERAARLEGDRPADLLGLVEEARAERRSCERNEGRGDKYFSHECFDGRFEGIVRLLVAGAGCWG